MVEAHDERSPYKEKTGFINVTLKRPAKGSKDAERCDMVNSLIIGWIMASIEEKLHSSISVVDDVSVMWENIKTRFSVNDGTREHQLHDDIWKTKQEGQSVEEYYDKLKMLWDDLAAFDRGFSCCYKKLSCTSMVQFNKKQDGIHIHQFLMGLDGHKFETTRSNLLARLPDLNIGKVYSQIVQEEHHFNVTWEEETPSTAIGLSASISKQYLLCTHCWCVSHEKQQCFKLVGYPEWWPDQTTSNKGTGVSYSHGKNSTRGREKGRGSQAVANQVTTTPPVGIPSLTPAQWTSLAGFLESKKESSGEKLTGKTDKLIHYGTHSRFDLIINSGASHHMTGDITLLSDLTSITACPIKMPNSGLTWATREGMLNLGGMMILPNLLYAPNLHITLISISQLLDDIASSVIFTKEFC